MRKSILEMKQEMKDLDTKIKEAEKKVKTDLSFVDSHGDIVTLKTSHYNDYFILNDGANKENFKLKIDNVPQVIKMFEALNKKLLAK